MYAILFKISANSTILSTTSFGFERRESTSKFQEVRHVLEVAPEKDLRKGLCSALDISHPSTNSMIEPTATTTVS